MKKVLVASAFAFFGILALSSCKKDYTCSFPTLSNGQAVPSITYNDLSKSKAKDTETACKNANGSWAKK